MTEWRKSSDSGSGDNCVEIGHRIGVRDSKNPARVLPVSPDSWSAFMKLAIGQSPR